MSEKSKIHEPAPLAIPDRDRVAVRPADVIREADLDKIGGGGGIAGGVVMRQHV